MLFQHQEITGFMKRIVALIGDSCLGTQNGCITSVKKIQVHVYVQVQTTLVKVPLWLFAATSSHARARAFQLKELKVSVHIKELNKYIKHCMQRENPQRFEMSSK
jgi:hypothetical protein